VFYVLRLKKIIGVQFVLKFVKKIHTILLSIKIYFDFSLRRLWNC